jgi:cyclic dehypoxanthinyl futalosine synthase
MGRRIKIGVVPFINAIPLIYGLKEDSDYILRFDSPREVARLLEEREIDLGLVPSASYAETGHWVIVPDIAIASKGEVKSVLIVADSPIEELEEIGLDTTSYTSCILAQILIKEFSLEPRFVPLSPSSIEGYVGARRGAMVIGDLALDLREKYAYVWDLGQKWQEFTSLPFVYAFWAAWEDRLDFRIVKDLKKSLRLGLGAISQIAKDSASSKRQEKMLCSYLGRNISYILGKDEVKALEVFFEFAAKLNLLPKVSLKFFRGKVKDKACISSLLSQVVEGKRLSVAEGLRLYEEASLLELGIAADLKRSQIHPQGIVTYIIDRNINYTNVCISRCLFCAFSRSLDSEEGYILRREDLAQKIEELISVGGTQILFQGGLHPGLKLNWFEDLLKWIKKRFKVFIHGFSPPEIIYIARVSDVSIEEVIRRLFRAGLDSIPGGGAEILVDRIRKKISPLKCSSSEWLEVMRIAHGLGIPTTATMVIGLGETPLDRIIHLMKLRHLQDSTHGFTSFIPWCFHHLNTRLSASDISVESYLRTVAISRLFLDNFKNIQASWPSQGPLIGEVALFFGANDFGSLMMEENVIRSAGVNFKISVSQIKRHICAAGFKPKQRIKTTG